MSNKMWGGRFARSPDAIMEEINASIDFDRHLYRQDIAASKAHAAMLAKQGIISARRCRADRSRSRHDPVRDRGRQVRVQAGARRHPYECRGRLAELIGPAAGRLHTARSRNDQVATDFRLWVRDAIDGLDAALAAYQRALAEKALAHAATVMPGFTHLQTAQPVTFGHHLLAYVEMAARDRGRFADARRRLNECPLGAAALAGTSFPLDRAMTAKALGFDRPAANSLDAVSDRDFVLETLAAAALRGGASVALRRRDRDLVARRWSASSSCPTSSPPAPRSCRRSATRMPPSWCAPRPAASSARSGPADRDEGPAARLPEGHAGRQGRRHGRARRAVALARRHDRHGARHDRRPRRACARRPARATRPRPISPTGWCSTLKMPFRDAHHVTGRIVAVAEQAGVALDRLPLAAMQAIEPASPGRVQGALGRAFGGEPHQLGRHRAGKCPQAGRGMAFPARRKGEIARNASGFCSKRFRPAPPIW